MTEKLIPIKTKEELALLRQAGKILSMITEELKQYIREGMTTQDIDSKAAELMATHNVKSAFKGYRGFPGTICVSLNEEVVHGIPGKKVLKKGDIASIDVGIVANDYYSDTAFTVGIGDMDSEHQRLIDVTRDSLEKGIEEAKAGNHLSDISFAIQDYVESKNFSVVKDFVGHGIGKMLHEEPEVPNFGLPHAGPLLKEGMVLAIEPMVNMGTWRTKILDDGWTVVTQDGKSSAHFEHTVAITKAGPQILTR